MAKEAQDYLNLELSHEAVESFEYFYPSSTLVIHFVNGKTMKVSIQDFGIPAIGLENPVLKVEIDDFEITTDDY